MAKLTFSEFIALKAQPLTFSTGKVEAADTAAIAGSVDAAGGDYGAGLIKNVVLAKVGYARGWGWHVEQSLIDAVAAFANAYTKGLKCRFQHPQYGILALGSAAAKIKNVRVEGNMAIGDMHILKSAAKSPLGNIGEYLLSMAAESPEDFALSIYGTIGVQYFYNASGDRVEIRSEKEYLEFLAMGEGTKWYISLGSLEACDAVDEGALTDGLFAAGIKRLAFDSQSSSASSSPTTMAKKRLAFDINATNQDGVNLRISTDHTAPQAGDEVYSVADDGTESPAPDGEHTITGGPLDGTKVTVKDGKIESVTPAAGANAAAGEGDAAEAARIEAAKGNDGKQVQFSAAEQAIMDRIAKLEQNVGTRLKTLENSPLAQHAGAGGGKDAFGGNGGNDNEELEDWERFALNRQKEAGGLFPTKP